MGIWNINWLFRRISKKKDSGGSRDKTTNFPAIMHTKRSKSNTTSGIEKKGSKNGSILRRKSRRESKKLQRDPRKRRTYSFSPGRTDIIQVPADIHRQHPVPPLPRNIETAKANPAANADAINSDESPIDSESRRRNRAASQAQLESQTWERVPTLHKRPGQELNRRKSSKKRKEEHDREAEIRAMSAMMPLKKQPVRMRSDVSLPPTGSIRSTRSLDERHASFKIAALDILSPHPTLRYAENPRYGRTVSTESRRNRVSERVKASEDILKSHKRVDDLAEEMDASELREIMERDKKRREKKKIEDQMRIERRLARRKARQEAEQAQAAENGTIPPTNMDRGVIGRELEGLETNTADIPSIERKRSTASERRRGKRPAEGSGEDAALDRGTAEPSNTSALVPGEEHEAAVLPQPASPRVRPQASGPQLMELDSAATSAPSDKFAKTYMGRQVSEGRSTQSWTSFFKRAKNRRGSTDSPSSFSNTSRDSIHARTEFPTQMPPLPLVRQTSSTVPKRTKSKFREDLPELPISPPDSRLPSPEVDAVPPMHSNFPEKLPAGRGSSESPHSEPSQRRYDTPTSGLVGGHRSNEVPSPEPNAILSQSLASIGSEGSWLSGRVSGSKRGSMLPPHPLRDSASSLQKRYREYSESAEELGIAEDEYFSRLTPGPEEEFKIQGEDQLPSSDGEEEIPSPTKWHGAVARQPQVVYHNARVVKSREGLLHDYANDASEPLTPTDQKSFGSDDLPPTDSPEAVIGRATSLEISRGPVRQISNASRRSDAIPEAA